MAGRGRYTRTVHDTVTLIKHAKLIEDELKPIIQVLYFAEEIIEDYTIMELDSSLLNKLQEGQCLTFRGEEHDLAVVCTEDETYEVKEAETSNSLLLLSDLKLSTDMESTHSEQQLEDTQVLGVYKKYYEVFLCKPRIFKLLQILEASQYQGKEFEEDLLQCPDIKMYTFDDLVPVIQASEVELRSALEEFLVCKIRGHLRLLEPSYTFQVVSFILRLVEENSWPLDGLLRADTIASLSELVDEEILMQVFDWLTSETGSTNSEGEPTWRLDEERVCRFLGEALLRHADKFNLADFLTVWQQSVPEGMNTHPRYLDGVALTDRKARPPIIWFYPETSLPEDVIERFQALFKIRKKWTFEEIYPYVQRLATPAMDVNGLLTKHTRCSELFGIKFYTSRHTM